MSLTVNGTERVLSTNTTIEEITSWYGHGPRVVTDSLFGGKAYSFYYGNNFDDYLYIETIADGRIFSYGSVDPSYQTATYSFNDTYPYTERNALYGCLLSDDNKIIGGVYYNKSIYLNGQSKTIINSYRARFEEEYCKINALDSSSEIGTDKDKGLQSRVMLDMSKHAILMYNGLMNYYNKPGNFFVTDRDSNGVDTFSTFENYFYINNQFIEFGTTLFNYLSDMGFGTSYYNTLGAKSNCDIAYSTYYIMNPLQLAGMGRLQKNKDLSNRNIPVWTYSYKDKKLNGTSFSPNCFDRYESIELNSVEKSRLYAGRLYYKEAIKKFGNDISTDLYKNLPRYETAAGLYEGLLKDNIKEGITFYYNSLRAANGLDLVIADDEGFNIAQHMTTLLEYGFVKYGNGLSHHPDQYPGVSDEYYNIAIRTGTSWGDSLSFIARQANTQSMIQHINNMLYDEDDSFQFGHRNHLLTPYYTRFGYGITGFFASLQLNGAHDTDFIATGMPAVDGVTFMENLIAKKFKWTIVFDENHYLVQDSCTTTIKCLNTGDTWTFKNEENNKGVRVYQNLTYDDITYSFANKILLYDRTIEPMAGYVYQVTVTGLKNKNTGKTENYTYRTTFQYADETKNPTSTNSLHINTDNLYKIDGYDSVYYAPIAKPLKLKLTMGDPTVVDKKVTWSSSNPEILSVTQDGTIWAEAPSKEQVIISVQFDGSTVSDQIVFMPYIPLTDVTLNESEFEMSPDPNGAGKEFQIVKIPDDADEIRGIDWAIFDGTREYYLTKTADNTIYNGAWIFRYHKDGEQDVDLNDYITVKEVGYDSKGYITSITINVEKKNPSTSSYDLKAYVNSVSDKYTDKPFGGHCDITVNTAITAVKSYIDGVEIVNDVCDLVVGENNKLEYTLTAKTVPDDEDTLNPNLSWTVESGPAQIKNGNVLVPTGVGQVIVRRGGVKPGIVTFNVTAPNIIGLTLLTDLEVNSEGVYQKGFVGNSGKTTQDVSFEKIPSYSTGAVQYSIVEQYNNKGIADTIATITQKGKINFLGVGKIKVRVASKTNSSVYSEIWIESKAILKNLRFEQDGQIRDKLVVDFDYCYDNLQHHDPDEIEPVSYVATYDAPSTTKPIDLPKVQYSLSDNVPVVNGKPLVRVDNYGQLYITGAIPAESNIVVYATVTPEIGEPLVCAYDLVVYKKADIDKVHLATSKNVSYSEEEDGSFTYYLSKGVTYHFSPAKDELSSDIYKIFRSNKDKNEIDYTLSEDEIVVTPTEPGEYTIKCLVRSYNYEFKNSTPVSSGASYVDDMQLSNKYQEKEITIKIVVSSYRKGDVNKDGFINAMDAAMVLDLYKNGNAVKENYDLGDMDSNNILNAFDAARILDIFKNS